MRILACIDASPYATAVCDYAGWLTGPFEQEITLLHAIEGGANVTFHEADGLLFSMGARLQDSGIESLHRVTRKGAFVEIAAAMAQSHSVLVVGKRGTGGPHDRLSLGSNIESLLRETERPICLVSSVFLPVSRALVLLDADPEHRRTVNFVREHPWLAELDADVVVMTDGQGGQAKLDWARSVLGATGADIFPISADGPHDALERYRREHPIDLLVLSREVALADCGAPLRRIEADSLWAWRAPVLIC